MNAIRWSPDGKYFTYVNAEGIQNIWQMSPDGTQQQPITDFKSGRIFNYTWTQDGKTIFIVRAIVNNDLVMIRDAESSPTP
jgi:Tol biopolymer transport system component